MPPDPIPLSPRPGRPRRLDETKRREIFALVSAGCNIRDAARYVRCAPSTIHREANQNEEFRDQLRRAELVSQLQPMCVMQHTIGTHWCAASWMLERTHPERFARYNPRSFGPKEARALTSDIMAIIKDEIPNPMFSERLNESSLRCATPCGPPGTRMNGRQRCAMEYFAQKDAGKFDPFQPPGLDFLFGQSQPSGQRPDEEPRQPAPTERNTKDRRCAVAVSRNDDAVFRRLAAGLSEAMSANPPVPPSTSASPPAADTRNDAPIPKTPWELLP